MYSANFSVKKIHLLNYFLEWHYLIIQVTAVITIVVYLILQLDNSQYIVVLADKNLYREFVIIYVEPAIFDHIKICPRIGNIQTYS